MSAYDSLIEKYLEGGSVEVRGNTLVAFVPPDTIVNRIAALMQDELPFIMLFATDERINHNAFFLHYVFGVPNTGAILALRTSVKDASFASLASEYPALALYEREIETMFGLKAQGHPDPRTLILQEENWPVGTYPLRKDFKWNANIPETKSGDYRFNLIRGEGIYEIPVGPVHAGIIEPGHFRFSVAGEEIVALEARLGFVHKGVEKLFEVLPLEKKISLAERISGDSAFSHSLAFCEAVEKLTATSVPERARYLRLIFAELERLTMHIFDIGNIGGMGTGFSVMASQGFRMVENLRRVSLSLAGNRFWRDINTPGGVAKDLSDDDRVKLKTFLSDLQGDFSDIIRIADSSSSFINRVKGTGVITREVLEDYGATGVPARSAGIRRDARLTHPYAAYADVQPELILVEGGDVEARFRARVREVCASIALLEKALEALPAGPISTSLPVMPRTGIAIGIVEGWRGEIAYAVQAKDGAVDRVKVRDPSFVHWQLFSHLASKDMVPDFPLINKSFNLSYTGNDL